MTVTNRPVRVAVCVWVDEKGAGMSLESGAVRDQVCVLVVEDDILIGLGLSMALNIAGYRVLGPVASVNRVLALCAKESPEIALVDVDLHGKPDGIDLARTLAERHGTTVIFLTGRPEQTWRARNCALGVIAKPYDLTAIPKAVQAAVRYRLGDQAPMVPHQLTLFR